MVPYVDAVVAVTVMRVLLFVLHVCMLRECEGDTNAGVGDGGDVFVVTEGHVGDKRCSSTVSSAADVLGMNVVRWMRGVGGVCDWVWVLSILWEQGECWTCVCVTVVYVGSGLGLGPGSRGVVLCLCE